MNKINGLDEIEIEDNLSSIDWYADAVCTARVRAHCVLNMFVAFSFDKIHNLVSKWLRKKNVLPICPSIVCIIHTQIRYIKLALKIWNDNRNSQIGWRCRWKIRVKNEKRNPENSERRCEFLTRARTKENCTTTTATTRNVTKDDMPLFVEIPK